MKIESTTTRLLDTIAANAKAGNAVPSALSMPADAVSGISGVQRAKSPTIDANGPGDFDAAKVERVRSAIEAGTYQIDAGAIADAMLSDARGFRAAGVF